jgi:hypothetical protein
MPAMGAAGVDPPLLGAHEVIEHHRPFEELPDVDHAGGAVDFHDLAQVANPVRTAVRTHAVIDQPDGQSSRAIVGLGLRLISRGNDEGARILDSQMPMATRPIGRLDRLGI